MKQLKILGLSLLALFALGVVAANAAFAEEGVLPPANFTIKGGTQELENLKKAKIVCTSVTGTGKFLTKEGEKDTHATGTLDFEGCRAEGFPANTLGDKSELILAEVLYLVCLENSAKLLWAVLVAPKELPVHIEVPALKVLLLVKGAVIGLYLTELKGKDVEGEPEGTVFGIAFKEEDISTRLKCSLTGIGEWTASYESGLDTESDVDAFQKGEVDATFAETVKLMDT